LTQKVR
jgi:hypothetical protein